MPSFPYTKVRRVTSWRNFHGTVGPRRVGTYCTPDVPTEIPAGAPDPLERNMTSIRAIVEHAFDNEETLRTVGSTWSLSRIIEPDNVLLDNGYMTGFHPLLESVMTDSFRTKRRRSRNSLVYVQAGSTISSINRRLGSLRLALPTSGAGNGHRIAGCIATGTHGAAYRFGAVHDAIVGVHLVVSPDRAVFLQPKSATCTDDVAAWLERETGVRTVNIEDDQLFRAAQVSLGGLGVAFGFVIEAAPLYRLRRRIKRIRPDDDTLNEAMAKGKPELLFPDEPKPYHYEVVYDPYGKQNKTTAAVVCHWKVSARGVPFKTANPATPDLASDHLGLIGTLADVLDGAAGTAALKAGIALELKNRYPGGSRSARFPGETFGYTSLPPGQGASTEFAVENRYVLKALKSVRKALDAEAAQGRLLLGAIALRFVAKSKAHLAMNCRSRSVFIELPGIRNNEVDDVFMAVWNQLRADGVRFGAHWGQQHDMDRDDLDAYYGDRVGEWKTARRRLLSTAARDVFTNPTIEDLRL